MEERTREGAFDEINISLQRQPSPHFQSKFSKIMSSHGKEFLFGLAVILSAYAAFQNRPLKTRKVGFPEPFFSKNSLVTDYFWGNVVQAFERMQDSDITFVMYYAPWDATSMDVRWEFEKTAKYYHEQIYFSAINCWWPDGECRHHFPKIHSFPILIAYHHNGKGVQFKGNPNFPQLVRFLDHLINPITVIHSRRELMQLLVKHNVVALGFLDFQILPQPPGYISFYTAAIKALERDPDRTVGFALLSNMVDASKFGLNTSKTIHLYLWNSTQAYVGNGSFSSHKILDWVFRKKAEVVRWLSPPGVKSLLLSSVLEHSPTLILFTPKYVTSSLKKSPFYYMLKEVALDYFNCNNSQHIKNMINTIRKETAADATAENISSDVSCVDEPASTDECCHSVVIETSPGNAFYNGSTACSVCRIGAVGRCHKFAGKLPSFEKKPPNCCTVDAAANLERYSISCCPKEDFDRCHRSQGLRSTYLKWPTNRYKCMLSNHSLVSDPIRAPKATFSKKFANFTGLGCRTNKTLTFVAMDSLQYNLFLERLGVNVLNMPWKTAVALIHAEQELHYTLNGVASIHNLREFILNYTYGQLQRHSRSAKTGDFISGESSETEIVVRDISSQSFNASIMDDTKDVVLLVYAPWCTFCYGISHIYLTVARYFQATKDIVFLRINGDANDLPWEFTVQKYPTIILFPAKRKADSVGFPEDVPITVTNLVHFVLTHSKSEIKLQTALSLCSSTCIQHNRKLALSNIRRLLHRFRTSDGRLRGVLDMLAEHCSDPRWASGTNRTRILNYVEYARHLTNELCEIRAQLGHAKALHMTLCTTEGDRLTRRQLEAILDSHGEFKSTFEDHRCKDMKHNLNNSLKSCLRHYPGQYEPCS